MSCTDDSKYVMVDLPNQDVEKTKFRKMVAISQKLYTSNVFKNKDDRSKRRKLVIRLRGLYENAKFRNESFEEAVVKCGWINFKQWLQETNVIKLDSADDQIKLYEMLKKRNEINWEFIKGNDLADHKDLVKNLVNLTSKLVKKYYDESKNLGPWDADSMAKELTDKNSNVIVIRNKINNELIGFILFRMELQVINVSEQYYECYVYELMIDNKYQRKGYGLYLMNICEFIAESKECDYIELTVFASNIAAIKFYRKQLKYNFDKNELHELKHDYRILTKIL